MKYRNKPFIEERGERQPVGLNHSSMACWGRLTVGRDHSDEWARTRSKHAVKSRTWGKEVALRSQAYQMEFEVFSLIGTTTLAMGCSRSRGVGSAMGLAWCLGEPKREDFS